MVTPVAKPAYVAALEAAYGPPSQAGFGSAVFSAPGGQPGDLEQAAQAQYQYFVGDLWQRYGAEAWLQSWRQLYRRPADPQRAIVSELRAINDRAAAQSVALLLDEVDDPQGAQAALSSAFDAPAVTDLAVFQIGDGAVLSGILLAARRGAGGETIMLIFLLD